MTEAAVLRVVLAEDNYLVREGTRQVLEAGDGVSVVATVGDAAALLEAVEDHRPDAVVTDIRMPPSHHMEGIEAAHLIRERWPQIGVVVLSQYADEAYAFALLERGTAGLAYLLKERVLDRADLVRALRETADGRSVLDPLVVDALVSRRARQERSKLSDLTDRETAVLSLMAEGHTNAGIGRELHLSASAVEKHINAIFTKLGLSPETEVHRRVAAVVTFLQHSGHTSAP
ncbi:MAG TPA: response regulator transcription factor [Nocardioidaceae bacterium]